MVSPAAIRRFTLSLDKSWGSRGSCLGKGQAELCVGRGLAAFPLPLTASSHLPVQDVADMGTGADGEEQSPGLQGSAEQAMLAGRDHRDCGATHCTGPAENAFQAVEARHQVLGTQGASGNGSGVEPGPRCSITCARR